MRTRLSAGEKPNRKRMAALVAVYDAEPARRRPHDVIAPPGGRAGGPGSTRSDEHGERAPPSWRAQPLPASGGRWRHYRAHLEPLIRALRDRGVALPSDA